VKNKPIEQQGFTNKPWQLFWLDKDVIGETRAKAVTGSNPDIHGTTRQSALNHFGKYAPFMLQPRNNDKDVRWIHLVNFANVCVA
jgi:hypothetical protein